MTKHTKPRKGAQSIEVIVQQFADLPAFCDKLLIVTDGERFVYQNSNYTVHCSVVGGAYHCNIRGTTNPSNAEGFNSKQPERAVAAAVRRFRDRVQRQLVRRLKVRGVDFSQFAVFRDMPPSRLRGTIFGGNVFGTSSPTKKPDYVSIERIDAFQLEERHTHLQHLEHSVTFEHGCSFVYFDSTYIVDVGYMRASRRYQIVVHDGHSKKSQYTHYGPLDVALAYAKKKWVSTRMLNIKRLTRLRERLLAAQEGVA